jgi:DNA-binding SARP family transcriptional activator
MSAPVIASSQAGGAPGESGGTCASPSLRLLGGFELTCAGVPVAMPLSAQRVLAFLAVAERPLPRSYVAGTLWMEASQSRAGSALRTAVWRIGEHGLAALHCDAGNLALHPDVEVDVRRITGYASAVLDGRDAVADTARRREILVAGDVLPGWYDDWVLVENERFRQLRLHALERLCLALSDAGRHAEATQAGLAAIAADPLRESAHRALVTAHLAYGNAGDALRQYLRCRDVLERELGVGPSHALEQLVAALRGSR